MAPEGTPAAMRSLPPDALSKPLSTFEVTQPLTLSGGVAAPAYGQFGLGTQYFTGTRTVADLIREGSLVRVAP